MLLLLWIILFIYVSCLSCFWSVGCSLVVACRETANLLALFCVMFYCVFVTFPCGVLGQVWNLVVRFLIFASLLTSMVYQLVDIYNNFCKSLDKGKEVRAVFCDISKAFDRVWHRGLLFKLESILSLLVFLIPYYYDSRIT